MGSAVYPKKESQAQDSSVHLYDVAAGGARADSSGAAREAQLCFGWLGWTAAG